MADSVRCTASSSNQFTCEIQVDADFDPPETRAARPAPSPPPPASPSPESTPAVSKLISTFVSRTQVQGPPAPPITVEALKQCASEELGIVLSVLARSKNNIVTGLAILKAGYDAGRCLSNAQDNAAERNARNYCHDKGGVVTSVDADKVTCEVHETAQ